MTRAEWDVLVQRANLKSAVGEHPLFSRYFFGILNEDGTCSLFEILDLNIDGVLRILEATHKVVVGFRPGMVRYVGHTRIREIEKRPEPIMLTAAEVAAYVDLIIDKKGFAPIIALADEVNDPRILKTTRERVEIILRRYKAVGAN
ncbi:hypothetical protein KBB85_02555 [Patescibacteria group bacterium]|nr:hypothetical protein [Patescibacteria group bacterium]